MKKTYSTYEAKARLSEILRAVRERGETVTVTYHGEPVAEIRPIPKGSEDRLTERIRRLELSGRVAPSPPQSGELRPVACRPGALERFLLERDS